MLRAMTSAVILSLAIAAGAALAQTPPATTPTPSASDKAAISKACSDQANAQNLHGKARKKFRAACKKRGGKPAT
jgi:uncharacterized low-complexity protein